MTSDQHTVALTRKCAPSCGSTRNLSAAAHVYASFYFPAVDYNLGRTCIPVVGDMQYY